jgi:hypothetical protein
MDEKINVRTGNTQNSNFNSSNNQDKFFDDNDVNNKGK